MRHELDPAVEEMFRAIRQGDTGRVILLLDAGMDINALGRRGGTALMAVVARGPLDLIRVLLDRGADLEVEGCTGLTALTSALVRAGYWRGWRIPVPDSRPLALLRAAGARFRLLEAVLLDDCDLACRRLDDGASPDTGERTYHGPMLMIAASLGHRAIMNLLLDRGARIEAEDDLNQTALVKAAHRDQVEAARCLLDRGAFVHARDVYGQSAVTAARRRGNSAMVALLQAHGAVWEAVDALELGDLPLLQARITVELAALAANAQWTAADYEPDDPALASFLRPAIDKLPERSSAGRLAMQAAQIGNVAAMRLLFDHGAAHLHPDDDDHSLLAEAARSGQLEMIRFLLDHGADLHAVGEDGLTPLAWAVRADQAETTELLCQAGATR